VGAEPGREQPRDRGEPRVELRVERDDGDRYPVTVAVADDGPAIPDREVEEREPRGTVARVWLPHRPLAGSPQGK